MRIASVKPSQRKKGRFLVEMEDGGILRVTEEELLRFSLREGMELDGGALEALEASAKASAARTAAANIIGSRPLSKRELTRRLVRKGAAEEDAGAAADWLEDGKARIREEMRRRGVDRELWDAALEELPDQSETLDRLIQKKCRGDLSDRREVKRVSDSLLRRGFSWSEVKEALRRYTELLEDESC